MSVTDGIGRTPCSLEQYLVQSAFRLVGWHFLPDEDGKMAETTSIVPLSLYFPTLYCLHAMYRNT